MQLILGSFGRYPLLPARFSACKCKRAFGRKSLTVLKKLRKSDFVSQQELTTSANSMLNKMQTIKDDSQSDYHAVKRAAAQAMQRGVWQNRFDIRFESLENRQMRCDLPRQAIDAIARGKHYASYRGLPMAKDPLDRVLYETLFYELQPRTVVELGAYTGASAMWMADVLKTFDIDCRVIAVDLDLELVDDAARLHGDVEFWEGDLNGAEDLFTLEKIEEFESPMILIDDAHVNITGVYQYFDRHALRSGDYLVIEDTIPWIPGKFGPNTMNTPTAKDQEPAVEDWGQWKWDEVLSFFGQCDAEYLVDRYYTDFFGYNGTWNWNGFLRKS